VKLGRNASCPEHRHGIRKESIHSAHPRGVRALDGGIEVHDLLAGMNAAVGPSGASHRHRAAADVRQCGLERVLYRVAARLRLPALEAAAVILES
jgi:hypothetical protein